MPAKAVCQPPKMLNVPAPSPATERRPGSSHKSLPSLWTPDQKKPRDRMRRGAKNWLVAANQRSSVKYAQRAKSDAILSRPLKTRRQQIRRQQMTLVNKHLAATASLVRLQHVVSRNLARHHNPVTTLSLRNRRVQRTALQLRHNTIGVLRSAVLALLLCAVRRVHTSLPLRHNSSSQLGE